jgi:hypothetical protein
MTSLDNREWSEGKFLVGDQPHSKIITFSCLIKMELFFKEVLGHLLIS